MASLVNTNILGICFAYLGRYSARKQRQIPFADDFFFIFSEITNLQRQKS